MSQHLEDSRILALQTLVVNLAGVCNLKVMSMLETVRTQALSLSQGERFRLVSDLIESLPPFPDESDDGVARGARRLAEGGADASAWLTEEEFFSAVRFARGK